MECNFASVTNSCFGNNVARIKFIVDGSEPSYILKDIDKVIVESGNKDVEIQVMESDSVSNVTILQGLSNKSIAHDADTDKPKTYRLSGSTIEDI